MSDRLDVLRDILSSDDAEDNAGPLDGERAAGATDANLEAEEVDDDDLSPEELVAESVRQTNDELGIEDDDEDDSADAETASGVDEPDEVAQLREKARLYDEYQAAEAERQVQAQANALQVEYDAVSSEWQTRRDHAVNHYGRELDKSLTRMEADAANAPDPEAYKRHWRPQIIAQNKQAEAAWLAQVDQDARIKAQAVETRANALAENARLQQQRPAYADYLMNHPDLGLPADDPEIRAEILRAGNDFAAMTNRAREIAWMVGRMKQAGRQIDQAQREVKAQEVRLKQPHPASATNKPRRAKPVEYAQRGPERRKQLAAIQSMA